MSRTRKASSTEGEGPESYRLWNSIVPEDKCWTNEYPLFTDAHLTGEIGGGLGPFRVINGRSFPDDIMATRDPVAGALLRVASEMFAEQPAPEEWKTSHDGYHGGTLVDEFAALLSLSLGARLSAGDSTRWFQPGGDPMGTPHGGSAPPILLRRRRAGTVIPSAGGTHGLNDAEQLLKTFPNLRPKAAFALVIAARGYQEALWLAESAPETAWLFLVSAIETAASYWNPASADHLDAVRLWNPKLYAYLAKLEQRDALSAAKQFSTLIGAGRKFSTFLSEFGPAARDQRPAFAALDWTEKSLEKSFKQIYSYRSKALHQGTPFPAPMCEAPRKFDPSEVFNEVPMGLGTKTRGGTWLQKDLPMLLCTFEYITRNALLNWWSSLCKATGNRRT